MPRWQKSLLTGAIALAGCGMTGQLVGYFSDPRTNGAEVSAPQSTAVAGTENPPQTWRRKYSPAMTRMGLSFVAAFVLGWVFRTFLKTMALITALAVAVFVGLSWFNVLNLDLTTARTKYESSMQWVGDQSGRLYDAAKSHLPGSVSTFAGLFIGFRRKR
ncbi:MAG: FUN14 domain-containing protein [Tepidisphaeraceae bacterium]